jgi:hypothetical protein
MTRSPETLPSKAELESMSVTEIDDHLKLLRQRRDISGKYVRTDAEKRIEVAEKVRSILLGREAAGELPVSRRK